MNANRPPKLPLIILYIYTVAPWATVRLHGAVVVTDIVDVPLFADNRQFTADLNNDGTTDIVFKTFTNELAAFSTFTSKIAGVPAIPPNQNSFAAALLGGELIGDSMPSLYGWNAGYSGLISCRDIGCLGLWGSVDAYVGVQFQIGPETHYGWVQIDTPFDFGGGYIKAFAYESEAGKSLGAGQIPEPSSLLICIATRSVSLLRRRRRLPWA